jgi:hypothetical protein
MREVAEEPPDLRCHLQLTGPILEIEKRQTHECERKL